MTQLTDHPAPSSDRDQAGRRSPEVFAAVLGGVVAAGLGFGVIAVLVLFMWITSPFPDSGPDGALRLAAALWLLAHGANLLRTDGLTGAAVPVGVTPLLLFALPCWLVHRAAAHALAPREEEPAPGAAALPGERDRQLGPVVTTAWLIGGYLLVGTVIAAFTRHGALRGVPLSALLDVPLVAVCAAACGAWSACGWHPLRPSPPVRRAMTRLALPYGGVAVALRAAVAGCVVLVGGGALLAGGSLLWHAPAAVADLTRLTNSLSGRCAVLLLTIALVPNAAVWAASYAMGPGFVLGTGSRFGPGGVHGYPVVLPDFPLLAALPGPTGRAGVSALVWLVAAVPVAAGAAVAWYVSRTAARRGWSAGRTTAVVLVACVLHGTLVAVAAACSGGPMGTGTLSAFGPDGARAGAAAMAWAAAAGLPVALAARWWLMREPDIKALGRPDQVEGPVTDSAAVVTAAEPAPIQP